MAYSSVMINNAGPSGVVKKLREDFLPTVAAEGMVWPPIMALLFACVPLSHQVRACGGVLGRSVVGHMQWEMGPGQRDMCKVRVPWGNHA